MEVTNQLITIFCEIDDFCKSLEEQMQHQLLTGHQKGRRGPETGITISEIMTILIMFHQVRFRDFKTFYINCVQRHWQSYFPKLPSYSRFVRLINRAIVPMTLFTQFKSGAHTGIYYIDSSSLPVCHLKRSRRHKTFESIAHYGKTSVGWFFGLKLHIVTNEQGELIAFKITKGHRNDAKEAGSLLEGLEGLAFGDKGYISKKLYEILIAKGLKLVTRTRKNMKKVALSSYEWQLLKQRSLVETVIGHLKYHYQIWHTRHRSVFNAMTHLVSALAAYAIEPLKISAIKLLQNMT